MSERKSNVLEILWTQENNSKDLKGQFAWQAIGENAGNEELKQDLIIKAHIYNAKEEAFKSAARIVADGI